LTQSTCKIGADIQLRTEVNGIEKTGDRLLVHASSNGEQRVFEADLVVHGAGRGPDIENLNLIAAQVESEKHGVKVNRYLQSTSNPSVYAAGDAASSGGPPLTHSLPER